MPGLRLAIVGAGPIGALSAAIAASRKHQVAFWCPRGAPRHGETSGNRVALRCVGAWEGAAEAELLPGPEALAAWPNILLAIPGNAYPAILPGLIPVLSDHHVVFCGGALSLVPLILAEEAAARGRRPGIAAWGTTLGTARIAHGAIQVGTVRTRFEMATLPASRLPVLLDLATALFGERFEPVASLLVPLLSNINPVAHAGQVIPNVSRIERGEAWQLFGCFGPAGARIAEAIDAERIAIAAAYGFQVRSLARHYHLSYHVPEGPIAEIAAAIEAVGRGPRGPASFVHRYIQEDMPFGLAVYEVLAKIACVPTPHLSRALDLLGLVTGHDLRSMNPLLDRLGLRGETVAGLVQRCGAG